MITIILRLIFTTKSTALSSKHINSETRLSSQQLLYLFRIMKFTTTNLCQTFNLVP